MVNSYALFKVDLLLLFLYHSGYHPVLSLLDYNRLYLLVIYSKCYVLCADVCLFVLFSSQIKSMLEIFYHYPLYSGAILTLKSVYVGLGSILFSSVLLIVFILVFLNMRKVKG